MFCSLTKRSPQTFRAAVLWVIKFEEKDNGQGTSTKGELEEVGLPMITLISDLFLAQVKSWILTSI